MDQSALTPAQLRVVEGLMDRPNRASRPVFEAELAAELRDELEDALSPLAEQLGVRELYVNKGRLARVLACEAHHVAEDEVGFGGWTPRAARGTVAHRAIELSVHLPGRAPLDVVDAAFDSILADDRDYSPASWLASATDAQRAELRAEVNDIVVKFTECWPPLAREWSPRTESSSRVDLCDDRIALSAKVDLALGRAEGMQARVLVIDLKTGPAYPTHLDDLRYYALVHTIRTGVPPFRVASYYLDACTYHHEDVTDDLLRTAVARVVDGTTRLVELHLRQRSPTVTPGPACGWCPRRHDCDGPARWRSRRGGDDLDAFDDPDDLDDDAAGR